MTNTERQGSLFYNSQETDIANTWTIEEKFKHFDFNNPHIYDKLKTAALRLKRSGRNKYGVKALFEALRWDGQTTTDGKEFKLSNDFTSLYARKLMENEPELKGFFNVRPRRSRKR